MQCRFVYKYSLFCVIMSTILAMRDMVDCMNQWAVFFLDSAEAAGAMICPSRPGAVPPASTGFLAAPAAHVTGS